MKLNEFIRTHSKEILKAWEHEVKDMALHQNLPQGQLRDHVEELLLAIEDDMQRAPPLSELRAETLSNTAAQADVHGSQREEVGSDVVHLSREFRALRRLVIGLWKNKFTQPQKGDFEEILTFNGLMDSALTQSIESYAKEVRRQGRLFKTMLSSLPNPCFILDLDGYFLYANSMLAEICGLTKEEIKDLRFSETRLPAAYNGQEHLDHVVQCKEQRSGEVDIEVSPGQTRCFEYVFVPVIDETDTMEAIAGICHDVTERKAAQSEIWHHANYDQLTAVPNRRLFQDRLEQQAAHSDRTGDPFTLFFIDLDHFKQINDELGHDYGDELLRKVAKRITRCLRHSDTVARIGGDEFTVILLDTNDHTLIRQIASNIMKELVRPFDLLGREIRISVSIGITLFPEDTTSADQLMRYSDQAMYMAKTTGRNRCCFHDENGQKEHRARRQLTNELRQATRSHQLRLYYQPIVDLSTGHIAKAEALIRWAHPSKGILEPEDFLHLAEESGLMAELEQWVFSEAALYLDHWGALATRREEKSFQLTVNASPTQFMVSGQVPPWQPYLEQFAGSKNSIALELTENVFLQDSNNLDERFAELKHANMELALDDFGSGYSSLAYLKRFNVHYLKIDQAFVRNQPLDSNSRIIAETIIVMAHKLGLKVVAEGVETTEQKNWLTTAGCDFAQGYLFARPLPHQEFSDMLETGVRFQ